MGFLPLVVDPDAVLGNLRVRLANNVHSGERFLDVALDTFGDFTHHAATLANSNWLSAVQLQQSLWTPANFQSAWSRTVEHYARVRLNTFKYFDECITSQHRAFDRLRSEA